MAKITGKEGLAFVGRARAFDTEDDFVKAVEDGSIKKGEKTVVILRYLGPKGGPGKRSAPHPTRAPRSTCTYATSRFARPGSSLPTARAQACLCFSHRRLAYGTVRAA